MVLHTILPYNTTPIHCTPLPLHPPVMNIHNNKTEAQNAAKALGHDAEGAAAAWAQINQLLTNHNNIRLSIDDMYSIIRMIDYSYKL